MVVGRKGSGKTAIFKKLVHLKNPQIFTYGHTFSDYPWHYHDKQARIGIPDYDKYTHSWKYLIFLTLAKLILNQDATLPHDKVSLQEMLKLEEFVIDSYGTRDPDVTQIFTPSKKLKLRPTFEIDLKLIKASLDAERVPIEHLPTIIQEVNLNLLNCVLSCLNPINKYYVCFDQLDLGFNPEDKEYTNRLVGLLLACRDINVKAKELGKQLFVTVFLRNDIYDNLHFEDKNKMTDNYLSMIEWDTPRTNKTLRGLMEKRFSRLLKEKEEDVIKWEDVFDETKEMTGHQTKYQHIIDRTYLRPRDIIKFCNEILEQCKHRINSEGNDETTASKVSNVDVNKAHGEYSNYFLDELDDEIHKHIPNYKKYLEIFKSIGVLKFSKEDYLSKYLEKKATLPEINDPMDILKKLFEFSVVGFYRVGGKGYGGSDYIYKYKDPRAQFDENATDFRLHPGLMDVLELKKYAKG